MLDFWRCLWVQRAQHDWVLSLLRRECGTRVPDPGSCVFFGHAGGRGIGHPCSAYGMLGAGIALLLSAITIVLSGLWVMAHLLRPSARKNNER